jgi:DNA-binding SARP family transcriptional activator
MTRQHDRHLVIEMTPGAHAPGRAGGLPDAVSLRLLGAFELRVDGALVSLPASTQRLVALLALRGRCGRSRLAGSLWPEVTEHRALASLRTGIWRVNQAVSGLVLSSHGSLDLGADADVDVRRLVRSSRALMGDASAGSVADADFTDDGGELLPDWEDEWLVDDRERLRQLRLHVLERLAERLADEGAYGLALESALAAVRSDALRESAHRVVIRIHLAEGNIAEAARAYDHCARVLAHEVGVAPSDATSSLVPPRLRHDYATSAATRA